MRRLLLASIFLVFLAVPNATCGDIQYSGIQNLTLQGTGWNQAGCPPACTQSLIIAMAGDSAGAWDQLKLSVFPDGLGSGGSNDVVPGSLVQLAAFTGANPNAPLYPYVKRLDSGDPFPSTSLYSGSLLLWDQLRLCSNGVCVDVPGADTGEFTDGTGYAAMILANGDLGWIHLNVSGAQSSTPTLTVIDWAYDNVPGVTISMGQGGPNPVPEPGFYGVLPLGILGLLTLRRSEGGAGR